VARGHVSGILDRLGTRGDVGRRWSVFRGIWARSRPEDVRRPIGEPSGRGTDAASAAETVEIMRTRCRPGGGACGRCAPCGGQQRFPLGTRAASIVHASCWVATRPASSGCPLSRTGAQSQACNPRLRRLCRSPTVSMERRLRSTAMRRREKVVRRDGGAAQSNAPRTAKLPPR